MFRVALLACAFIHSPQSTICLHPCLSFLPPTVCTCASHPPHFAICLCTCASHSPHYAVGLCICASRLPHFAIGLHLCLARPPGPSYGRVPRARGRPRPKRAAGAVPAAASAQALRQAAGGRGQIGEQTDRLGAAWLRVPERRAVATLLPRARCLPSRLYRPALGLSHTPKPALGTLSQPAPFRPFTCRSFQLPAHPSRSVRLRADVSS
jgi:hypothetical protein